MAGRRRGVAVLTDQIADSFSLAIHIHIDGDIVTLTP
jgi:hypothetical protein